MKLKTFSLQPSPYPPLDTGTKRPLKKLEKAPGANFKSQNLTKPPLS